MSSAFSNPDADSDSMPLICHRCGTELTPGDGNFYLVRIEAMCDPSPPNLSSEKTSEELRAEIAELIEQSSELSEQELQDHVYRRFTIHLCYPCYANWIENPTGR